MSSKSNTAPSTETGHEPKRALGRGLSALIPSSGRSIASFSSDATAPEAESNGLRFIPLVKIALNPFQPREAFSPDQLDELTDSIRQHGVLQPIVVRPKGKATYELVAGERRFRAATQAGLREIPAVVREIDDKSSLAIALIENIQRQELNPVESARAYQRLLTEFRLTQTELAAEVGKSQPAIANSLRLLQLPEPIIDSLGSKGITEGHAKAILAIEEDEDKITVWKAVVKGALSVRETERRVAAIKATIPRGIPRTIIQPNKVEDIETEKLQQELSLTLGTKVKINFQSREKGQIEIQFYGLDQLDGLLQKIAGEK